MFKPLTVVFLTVASFPLFAADREPEWRLLGPAWSFHASEKRAPIRQHAYGVWDCSQSGGATCTGSVVSAQRAWSSTNPAVGLELTVPSADGSSHDLFYGTVVRDSYGKMGLMLAAGHVWNVASLGTFALEAGLAGGLWYRTVDNGLVRKERIRYCPAGMPSNDPSCPPSNRFALETELKRRIVPFVLPVVSLKERYTGLGINVGFVPRIRVGRFETTPTSTVMVQLSYKIAF